MQNNQNPNTRPIAKHVKKQKTNLGKLSDQLKIHRNVYQDYLQNNLNFGSRTVDKLIRLYERMIDADQMEILFKLPIATFHKAFLQKLDSM